MIFSLTRTWFLIGCCLPLLLNAQDIDLPRIQSQYLYQAPNNSAPILTIHYDQNQAQLHSPNGLIALSQENITQLLADDKRTQPPTKRLLSAAVRLHAPANLPIRYFNDLFFWLRIGGCNTLSIGIIEESQPNQTKYLSIPIAPFTLNKKIYKDIAAAQQVHPNTSFLDVPFSWDWYFEQIKTQAIAYVPSRLTPLTLKEGQVLFQEQPVNPMLLSTLIQTTLAKQYGNSYNKATPNRYWSLIVNLENTAHYQDFVTIMGAIVEGYHLYWEELAFAKYQQTYLELEPTVRWEVQQTAPLLPLYYDILQTQALSSLYKQNPVLWSELERH